MSQQGCLILKERKEAMGISRSIVVVLLILIENKTNKSSSSPSSSSSSSSLPYCTYFPFLSLSLSLDFLFLSLSLPLSIVVLLFLSDASSQMMIIQDEEIFKAESTMIAEPNSIIKDDEINDLSVVNLKRPSTDDPLNKPNEDFYKSPNKRKQIKPNRSVLLEFTLPSFTLLVMLSDWPMITSRSPMVRRQRNHRPILNKHLHWNNKRPTVTSANVRSAINIFLKRISLRNMACWTLPHRHYLHRLLPHRHRHCRLHRSYLRNNPHPWSSIRRSAKIIVKYVRRKRAFTTDVNPFVSI